ncbi:Uridine-cytidine kinase C [Vitis vinifera]|uniref:Uridine-cytidine kinase C n=1 Tax=Vitis vinifera TaxID=29760 RepID=A0A438EAG4_VITVI|nr:Uridine-cytidine kinase C [Vitis vinifera]
MAQDTSGAESPQPRPGLLKDQVRLVRRKNSDRCEIVPIQDRLSFEKGFFIVIRACQLLAQNNDGIILVGLAGPSGAGKTVFTEKILNFMPSIAVISMDNYNDASRIVDGNFDGYVSNNSKVAKMLFSPCDAQVYDSSGWFEFSIFGGLEMINQFEPGYKSNASGFTIVVLELRLWLGGY